MKQMKTKLPHLKPKGAKGRAMVKKLGRTYKTGGFKKIASKAAAKYGSAEAGKKVAGAIFQKMRKFKKGGKVEKTGPAVLHKGERVLNSKQAEKFEATKDKETKKDIASEMPGKGMVGKMMMADKQSKKHLKKMLG